MSHTKRAIAAKMLHDAQLHLMGTRKLGTYERAYAILSEAERYTRNGFTSPIDYDYFAFDSEFVSGGETKPLYKLDSISPV